MPETPIDAACAWHDDAMDTDDPFVDWKLAGKWLSVNPFKSENYRPDHQIYDRVYQYGAATTMILVGTVRAPFRLLKKGWRKLRGT